MLRIEIVQFSPFINRRYPQLPRAHMSHVNREQTYEITLTRRLPMFADYHVHTEFSDDSVYPMDTVVQDAIHRGMDEICFTEHVDYGIKDDWDAGKEIRWRNGEPIANADYPSSESHTSLRTWISAYRIIPESAVSELHRKNCSNELSPDSRVKHEKIFC